jgi:hypothetical protein
VCKASFKAETINAFPLLREERLAFTHFLGSVIQCRYHGFKKQTKVRIEIAISSTKLNKNYTHHVNNIISLRTLAQ